MIDRLKLCFKMIRPRIILHHAKNHFFLSFFVSLYLHFNPFFSLGFFPFHFFFYFFSFFCIFSLWTLAFLMSPNFFSRLKFFAACLLTKGAFMIFHDPWNFTFRHLSSSVKGDPWSDSEKKSSGSKRVTTDNFLY